MEKLNFNLKKSTSSLVVLLSLQVLSACSSSFNARLKESMPRDEVSSSYGEFTIPLEEEVVATKPFVLKPNIKGTLYDEPIIDLMSKTEELVPPAEEFSLHKQMPSAENKIEFYNSRIRSHLKKQFPDLKIEDISWEEAGLISVTLRESEGAKIFGRGISYDLALEDLYNSVSSFYNSEYGKIPDEINEISSNPKFITAEVYVSDFGTDLTTIFGSEDFKKPIEQFYNKKLKLNTRLSGTITFQLIFKKGNPKAVISDVNVIGTFSEFEKEFVDFTKNLIFQTDFTTATCQENSNMPDGDVLVKYPFHFDAK